MRRVLVDAGPLVAIASPADHYHSVCVHTLHKLPGPLFCSWPVVTEAAWLLRRNEKVVRQLLDSIAGGFLEILSLQSTEATEIAAVMKRYKNIRPELADASLVYLAERDGFDTIFTLDRRDFSIYRIGRNRTFHIVP